MTRNRRLIIIAAILLLSAIIISIIVGLTQYAERQGKAAITFHIMPDDADLVINNKKVKSGSTTYLDEGDYTYTVSRSGFEQQQRDLKVDSTTELSQFVMLVPNSEEGTKWLNDNQRKTTQFENLAGQAAVDRGVAVSKKNPIVDDLPLRNLLFVIGYKNDSSDPSGNSIIVTIRAPEQYRQDAISRIAKLGHRISDYKYEFYDMEDPFDEN